MTRTEQHLEGYDSARGIVQGLLTKYKMKNTEEFFKEIVAFAETSYYESDGKDWSIHCEGCKHYKQDMDYHWYCTERLRHNQPSSFDECPVREEKLGQ